MRFKKIINLFDSGNVCVTGLRGTGKDLLFGNVISRRNKAYISNLNYTQGKNFIKINFDNLNLNYNTFNNLINNNVKKYDFNDFYADGTDIYLSDAGIYFPSQYNNELNNRFKHFPMYMALSRQVSSNNFHINVQNLNRCWDKIREQSDIYICCNKVIYIPLSKIPLFRLLFSKDFVIQKITMYDRYESCVSRLKPLKIRIPLFGREQKAHARFIIENFKSTNGMIKSSFLFYFNKSKHNTLEFKEVFKNGSKEY